MILFLRVRFLRVLAYSSAELFRDNLFVSIPYCDRAATRFTWLGEAYRLPLAFRAYEFMREAPCYLSRSFAESLLPLVVCLLDVSLCHIFMRVAVSMRIRKLAKAPGLIILFVLNNKTAAIQSNYW